MHDNQLEDRVRAVLRAEGDALPVTITREELERGLSRRRRERFGQRLSLLAAGMAAVLVASLVGASIRWFEGPSVGSSPDPGPSEQNVVGPSNDVPGGPEPTSSLPAISLDGPCAPLDVATVDRPPLVIIGVLPPNGASSVHSGQLGAFRLGGRDVGNVGSWDHDTVAFEPAETGVWSGITVLSVIPDTCLVGVAVDAVPYGSIPAISPATAIDSAISEPRRLAGFRAPPIGDWFVRVHVVFQTSDDSEALSETFFRIVVEESSREPSTPGECEPLDPSLSATPPAVGAGASPGDAIAYGGQLTAYKWNEAEVGTPGSWTFPNEPDLIRIDPDVQSLGFISDSCLLEVTAEAVLTEYAAAQASRSDPIALRVVAGAGSRVVHVTPPPTGRWTVRVRAVIATTDRALAWSETLFAVIGAFNAPTLTMRRAGGIAVSAAAGCPNYSLGSGALSADTCGASFTVNGAAIRMPVGSGQPVDLALSDGWEIDGARVTAVDAGLVASGEFAPEHSVAFIEQGGAQVTFPMTLEPSRWIVRVALNGSRGGDSFDAYYDLSVEITP